MWLSPADIRAVSLRACIRTKKKWIAELPSAFPTHMK